MKQDRGSGKERRVIVYFYLFDRIYRLLSVDIPSSIQYKCGDTLPERDCRPSRLRRRGWFREPVLPADCKPVEEPEIFLFSSTLNPASINFANLALTSARHLATVFVPFDHLKIARPPPHAQVKR
jgi:hypothetical protein